MSTFTNTSVAQKTLRFCALSLAFLLFGQLNRVALAFTCHKVVNGPVSFEIGKIEPLTVEGKIYRAPLIIVNNSDANLTVEARITSIDSFYLYDETKLGKPDEIAPGQELVRTVVSPAHSTYESTVAFAARGAYLDAHYPVRASFSYQLDNRSETVDLRPVFATQLKELLPESKTLEPLSFQGKPYLKLNGTANQRYATYARSFNGEFTRLPNNWSGSDAQTGASLNPCNMSRGGIIRESWSTHPPYKGGAGVVGARFVVSLPEAREISLKFFSAMRDVFPPEPPTDGVEFRVYASHVLTAGNGEIATETLEELANRQPRQEELLYAEQYKGVEWKENKVDLTKFQGETILLTLEADPGAKGDTTCDSSFWGDVVILTNSEPVKLASVEEREALRQTNENAFLSFAKTAPKTTPTFGVPASDAPANTRVFNLGDSQFAAVTLGPNGVCDGWVTIGTVDKHVQIDGVRAKYQGVEVGFDAPYEPCKAFARFVDAEKLETTARAFAKARRASIIGDLPNDYSPDATPDETFEENQSNELACFIAQTRGGLAFRFVATHNDEINSLQFGAFSEHANRVYFGQGHCIVEPKAFNQDGDGFACSTSHVGFDFANGISVLEATTRPVYSFVVNPDLKVYTLTTSPDSRLTLRSSDRGAMRCALDYAAGFDKSAAPLVPKKAGRFVFDYWGGSYGAVLERMKTFVKYGLTDSLLIQHVWQHYGYDVRLPDIWPPRPEQGSLEELQETQKFCDLYDIPFGLHDNYIDYYPDADGFNYDEIIINPDGQPQKAWYNPGPDVQSYRFNPTYIFKHAERNLDLIREHLMQTAYFTDVFSSIRMMDFYDRTGRYHSRAETQDCWGRYFDLVREKFNGNAITVSESGSDSLIGHLDGADGILRRISSGQENYSSALPCEDDAYVPWGDAVYHDKFILHGVGYSDRYQGGLARSLRGIESDDYICSEALLGHAVMVDLSASISGSIRKYWLMQNLARSLALDTISDFEFVDGNIHHAKVTWNSGVVVYVNRDRDDWTLTNNLIPQLGVPVVLPRFGFWAVNERDVKEPSTHYGGIVRLDGQIVEFRVDGDESFFVNGRKRTPNQVVPIRASLENVEVIDGATLRGALVWDATTPTLDKAYTPFLHLERPKTWWGDKPELTVLPLAKPNKPSNVWQGRETKLFGDSITIAIPDSIPPGNYNILCGLYDPATGKRLPLLGRNDSNDRYILGSVTVAGTGNERTLSFAAVEPLYGVDARLIPNAKASNFGVCSTLGAIRYEQKSPALATVTPLPDSGAFDATLATAFLQTGEFEVVERDADGQEIQRTPLRVEEGKATLRLDTTRVFSIDIEKR